MSWLSDRTNTDANRAKWKFQREAEAGAVKDGSRIGTLRRRINADDALTEEMNARAKEQARDAIPPPFRGRDILSSGLTNALLGAAALLAVASQNPEVHETLETGLQNAVSEISANVSAAKSALTSSPFAPAFDNE